MLSVIQIYLFNLRSLKSNATEVHYKCIYVCIPFPTQSTLLSPSNILLYFCAMHGNKFRLSIRIFVTIIQMYTRESTVTRKCLICSRIYMKLAWSQPSVWCYIIATRIYALSYTAFHVLSYTSKAIKFTIISLIYTSIARLCLCVKLIFYSMWCVVLVLSMEQ